MPELRKDPLIGRWVIFSPERGKRPTDFVTPEEGSSQNKSCPFCFGNEEQTPPEIYASRPKGVANSPGWDLRIVPNKFPALAPEGEFQEQEEGIYVKSQGVGGHEVIIETPEHLLHLEEQDLEGVQRVLQTYKDRVEVLLKDPRLEYVLIFKNVGLDAGASLEHPHSQIIATPIIPKRIQEKVDGIKKHRQKTGNCLLCDIIIQEKSEKSRLVYENEAFISFCPYASKFPYQMMLLPKKHQAELHEISNEEMQLFADCVKVTLTKLATALKKPQYNFVLNIGPKKSDFHWHLEILPRVTRIAGFEWGSDFFINPVMPEDAANDLRQV